MSLTGAALAWILVILTVVVFAGVIVGWSRLGSQRVLTIAARVGLLLGLNLLVLLTVAVQLNDQYLFFADWGDLNGALNGTTVTTGLHRGGTADQAAKATVAGQAVAAPPAVLQPLPAGSQVQQGVISYQVSGSRSGLTGTVLVAVPPGYNPANPSGYPVLETFSGYPGSPAQWVKTMHLQSAMADQVAAHKMRSAIIVSPQVEFPAGADTECVNGRPGQPQVETWATEDIPAWVATHYRVAAARGSWATIGLSAGAWCAAMASVLHPAQYGAAVIMGGYFHPLFGVAYDPFPARSDAAHRYDLVAAVKRTAPPLALWLETSHADPLSYTSSADLLKAAKPPLSVSATVLQNAGHRMDVWQNLLPAALTWLGSSQPGFRP